MNKDFEKRISLWKKQIESYERLTIAEAKDILLDSVMYDEEKRNEMLLRVFEGTMYIPIETISKIPFYIAEKPTLDVDDIITSALEEWYKIIKDYSLLDVSFFGNVADAKFIYGAVNDNISSNELDLNHRYFSRNDVIDKALFDCIKLNLGSELTIDDVKKVLSNYPESIKDYCSYDDISNLAQTVFTLYNKLHLEEDKELDLSERQFNLMKKLFRYDFASERLDRSIPDNSEDEIGKELFDDLVLKMINDNQICLVKDGKKIYTELSDREKRLLDLRYGLTDGKPRTLEQVGKIMGIPRENARQIEAKAIRKLHASQYSEVVDEVGVDYITEKESKKPVL